LGCVHAVTQWLPGVSGLAAFGINQLVASAGRHGVVYAEAGRAFPSPVSSMAHQSKDLGKTWTALGPTGLPEEVLTLDAERGILYAAGGIISPGSPIFRSTDDGATWSATPSER
jgi:hypothetical protein